MSLTHSHCDCHFHFAKFKNEYIILIIYNIQVTTSKLTISTTISISNTVLNLA